MVNFAQPLDEIKTADAPRRISDEEDFYLQMQALNLDHQEESKNNVSSHLHFSANNEHAFFFNRTASIRDVTDKLAKSILWGFPDQADSLIQQHANILPDILLQPVTVRGPNSIQPSRPATIYQLLLWTDDNYILDQQGSTFLEKIRNVLVNCHGQTVEESQRLSWCERIDQVTLLTNLKEAFDRVVNTLEHASIVSEHKLITDNSLQNTYQAFSVLLSETAKVSLNCIPLIFDYVITYYRNHFENNGGYGEDHWTGSPKNRFLAHKLLGLIELYLPTWGMQVLVNGLDASIQGGSVLRRDIAIYYTNQDRVLGQNAVVGFNGAIVESLGPSGIHWEEPTTLLHTYIQRQEGLRWERDSRQAPTLA